jgi:hypothetical protein
VKALLGFVMNAKYARQETVGLEEMGLRVVQKGERQPYRIKSPQDALGRRVVDDGGNVRWEGLHNPSLYDEAQRQCVVVTRFPESEEDVITLLRSCISRDGTHALAILTNDTAAGLELFAKLEKYWYENYTDLHFRVEEEEEDERDDSLAQAVRPLGEREDPYLRLYGQIGRQPKRAEKTLRERATAILGRESSICEMANAYLGFVRDVTSVRRTRTSTQKGAAVVRRETTWGEQEDVAAMRACAGLSRLPWRSMEGSSREKRFERAAAGAWLVSHGMVQEKYVPLDTADPDDPRNENARFLRMGSAVLSVRGTKKTSLGHAPRGPREVGVMMDTCVPVDA